MASLAKLGVMAVSLGAVSLVVVRGYELSGFFAKSSDAELMQ